MTLYVAPGDAIVLGEGPKLDLQQRPKRENGRASGGGGIGAGQEDSKSLPVEERKEEESACAGLKAAGGDGEVEQGQVWQVC